MRTFLTAVCLLVCLTACSNDDDVMRQIPRDVFYVTGTPPCQPSVWITGVIVKSAGIQDDNGVVSGLIWGLNNTARVEYGKRYKIGGQWFGNPGGTLWACNAEAVIPQ